MVEPALLKNKGCTNPDSGTLCADLQDPQMGTHCNLSIFSGGLPWKALAVTFGSCRSGSPGFHLHRPSLFDLEMFSLPCFFKVHNGG